MAISFEEILGKTLLIGVTYYTHDKQFVKRKQFYGTVISVKKGGITIEQSDGSFYTMPPDLRTTQKAAPGEYRLRSTGEIIINPDFLATWLSYYPQKP